MPPLDQILGTRLRSSVRDLWSGCLNAHLAGVIAHSDTRAWVDFLSLPSVVIPSPAHDGTNRTRRSTNETRRHCQDWPKGVRLKLWDPPQRASNRDPSKGPSLPHETAFELDDRTAARYTPFHGRGPSLHSPVNLPSSLRRSRR